MINSCLCFAGVYFYGASSYLFFQKQVQTVSSENFTIKACALSFTGTARPWSRAATPEAAFSRHCKESGLKAEDCTHAHAHTNRHTHTQALLNRLWTFFGMPYAEAHVWSTPGSSRFQTLVPCSAFAGLAPPSWPFEWRETQLVDPFNPAEALLPPFTLV